MKRRTVGTIAAATGTAVALSLAAAPAPLANANQPGGQGVRGVALTDDNRLVRFRAQSPGQAVVVGQITGLEGDTRLVGMDFRVQDRRLYGVGDQGGVYAIGRAQARAVKVSQLTVDLEGENFGVDFNPAADRLRVVSDTGQNLRHDVNPGGETIEDGTLTYPPAEDTATGVLAAAYTNNDLNDATGTTLFVVDRDQNQAAIQSPANAGSLAATASLRIPLTGAVGMDIRTAVRDGRTINRAFTVVQRQANHVIFRVKPLDGTMQRFGRFQPGVNVVDISFPIVTPAN